jgi:hypothetical protein
VLLTRCEGDSRAQNVAGFQACKLLPLIVPEVAERSRTLLPWIPDNRGCRVHFLRPNSSTPRRIYQFCGALNVDVGIVSRRRKGQIPRLVLSAVSIDVIQISDLIETANAHVFHPAHPKIRVQGLFETKGSLPGIPDIQFKLKTFADGQLVYQAKPMRLPAIR